MAGGVATAAAAIGQQLLGSGVLEGSGHSDTNAGSHGATQSKGSTDTSTKGITSNKGFTANQGITANKGVTSTKGSVTNQQTTGTSSTVGNKQTTGTSSTTVGTADKGALDTARSITEGALKASTDNGAITDLINSTLNKASIAFAPTLAQGTAGSGLYNGSTVDLLSGYAKGQATADATQAVLQYKQGEEQIATNANQGIIDATKGSTTSGATTTAGTQNTVGTDTTAGTQNTTGVSNAANTSKTENTQKTEDTSKSNTNTDTDTSSKVGYVTKNNSHVDQTSQSQQNGLLTNSVICTELMRQGKLDKRDWMVSAIHFNKEVSETGRTAYKTWSAPVVGWIQKYPDGRVATISTIIMKGRSKNIAWSMDRKRSQFKWTDLGCRILVDSITHITSWLTIHPSHWSIR